MTASYDRLLRPPLMTVSMAGLLSALKAKGKADMKAKSF
jgi:hypothetical protein